MKKLVAFTTLSAFLGTAGMVLLSHVAGERSAEANAPGDASVPHKIALIDMAHVFKNYKKFEARREGLKTEITTSEERIKKDLEAIKILQQQLKSLVEGSPEYKVKEQELASKAADIQAYREVQQRDFLRKESQIYKEIYGEVSEAVGKYAEYYKYSLVMRFKRDEMPEADNPNDVINKMNGTVIYHRAEDDITDAVLKFLNDRYDRGVIPTSGTR